MDVWGETWAGSDPQAWSGAGARAGFYSFAGFLDGFILVVTVMVVADLPGPGLVEHLEVLVACVNL